MTQEAAFLSDRMLGTLTRYLRFLGYDCESADSLPPGNRGEDTLLLAWAEKENRILLTRDRELAERAHDRGICIRELDVMDQIRSLQERGLIDLNVRLIRCSVCNMLLRNATDEEIGKTRYAPSDTTGFSFFWCERCRRLYWDGSHTENITSRIRSLNQRSE